MRTSRPSTTSASLSFSFPTAAGYHSVAVVWQQLRDRSASQSTTPICAVRFVSAGEHTFSENILEVEERRENENRRSSEEIRTDDFEPYPEGFTAKLLEIPDRFGLLPRIGSEQGRQIDDRCERRMTFIDLRSVHSRQPASFRRSLHYDDSEAAMKKYLAIRAVSVKTFSPAP